MVGEAIAVLGLGTLCVVSAIFPRQMFRLFEAWRFKDPDSVELDDFIVTVRVLVYACTAVGCYAWSFWVLVLR